MNPPLEPPRSTHTGTHQMPYTDWQVKISAEVVMPIRASTEAQAKRIALAAWRRMELAPDVEAEPR